MNSVADRTFTPVSNAAQNSQNCKRPHTWEAAKRKRQLWLPLQLPLLGLTAKRKRAGNRTLPIQSLGQSFIINDTLLASLSSDVRRIYAVM
jgi:hypothetical protein